MGTFLNVKTYTAPDSKLNSNPQYKQMLIVVRRIITLIIFFLAFSSVRVITTPRKLLLLNKIQVFLFNALIL